METNELKKLIGRECLVLDPRSKKKVFQPATIKSVSWSCQSFNNDSGDFYETIHYRVSLHKVSISGSGWLKGQEYHRSFDVGNNSIRIE